jgi:hypothetical protein
VPSRAAIVAVLAAAALLVSPVTARAGGGGGGGGGGISGSGIWSRAWWAGSPLGPGPYTGGPGGGFAICVWLDLGPTTADLNGGLDQSSLPTSFWTKYSGGGHPGIWGVDQWADALARTGVPGAHFDLVACPNPSGVPASRSDIETSLPVAEPPSGGPRWLWIFWDTVPDPPAGRLPPIVGEAFRRTQLPRPVLSTSPSEVGGVPHATVVNFPTWLWIGSGIWRTYEARAAGGGYVATVWAYPTAVRWRAAWDFPNPRADPEGGVTFGPERLDESCAGPGVPYEPSEAAGGSSECSFVFTQSTFGTRQRLVASVAWSVHWALSSPAGIVGGEGLLGTVATRSSLRLRVMQVESIITAG